MREDKKGLKLSLVAKSGASRAVGRSRQKGLASSAPARRVQLPRPWSGVCLISQNSAIALPVLGLARSLTGKLEGVANVVTNWHGKWRDLAWRSLISHNFDPSIVRRPGSFPAVKLFCEQKVGWLIRRKLKCKSDKARSDLIKSQRCCSGMLPARHFRLRGSNPGQRSHPMASCSERAEPAPMSPAAICLLADGAL